MIRYLGRYTHRIAIGNRRLISVRQGKVTFAYKDRSDNDQNKTLTLGATEFVRRFLLHVLPEGFHKIRYFGLLAIRNRKSKLAEAQRQLNPTFLTPQTPEFSGLGAMEEPTISKPPCPACGANTWHCVEILPSKLFKATSGYIAARPPPESIPLQISR